MPLPHKKKTKKELKTKMLGTGTAAQAGKLIKKRKRKMKTRLGDIMGSIRRSR